MLAVVSNQAIAFDHFRRLARAFCKTDDVFKNLPLWRILRTRSVHANAVKNAADLDLRVHLTLEIGPNPEATENQKTVIELDLEMHGRKAQIKVRRALLCHDLKRLELDTDPGATEPQDHQIVLLKRGP